MQTAFCFVPGENEGKRKLIYRTSKCIRKCYGNLNRTISIITLAHIHQSWQTTNFSQIEIIETEFATCQGEDDTVRRCLFHKFGVIVFVPVLAPSQPATRKKWRIAPDFTASITVFAWDRIAA